MTLDDARAALRARSSMSQMAEAITVLWEEPESRIDDWLLALEQPGFIAEQAAFTLHRLHNVPKGRQIGRVVIEESGFWRFFLAAGDTAGAAIGAIARSFSAETRIVLGLTYYSNWTADEIAALLKVTPEGVRAVLEDGLRQLRVALAAGAPQTVAEECERLLRRAG